MYISAWQMCQNLPNRHQHYETLVVFQTGFGQVCAPSCSKPPKCAKRGRAIGLSEFGLVTSNVDPPPLPQFLAIHPTPPLPPLPLLESGEWRVEGGEWRMESGEWRVESGGSGGSGRSGESGGSGIGKWRMESGEWRKRMESGEWRVENGELRMEGGEWRMESGGWRMENGGSTLSTPPLPPPLHSL